MKSPKLSLLSKSITAGIIGSSLAASAAFAISLTPNVLGTPDDGMICRPGYTGALTGSSFKCSKAAEVKLNLECTDPNFPEYVIRAQVAGTPNGEDICSKANLNIATNGAIGGATGLVQGTHWVFAQVNTATVNSKVADADAQEASALGLDARDVDTLAGTAVKNFNPARDKAIVPLTHYTFAIPTGNTLAAARR
jgi:hypothetical protein